MRDKNKLDIAFLGGVFEKHKINEIMNKSKSGIQFAADALQWNIIEGLDYWNETPVTIINAPFIGSYPKHYKDIYLKQSKWSHCVNAHDINIGFLNIVVVKNIFRAVEIAKQLKMWARDKENEKVVIAYSINLPFLWAIRESKKLKSTVTTCLIVPDLPAHMNLATNVSIIYKIAKKIECVLIEKLLKYVDSFVLLTEPMAEALGVNERSYCVVEGMVNQNDLGTSLKNEDEQQQTKSILYTGTLNYKYGIGRLLEAFELIQDSSYELWLCGYGEAEEHIKKLAEVDQRIKWFGAVSREQALSLQQKATVLINPRPAGEEFTKYSFPSKNLEYLLSGRPVIAYKLPGIPAEYDKFIFFIEGDAVKDIADKIISVCTLSQEEQNQFGEQAKMFVLDHKNNVVQVKKIIDMIEMINKQKRIMI